MKLNLSIVLVLAACGVVFSSGHRRSRPRRRLISRANCVLSQSNVVKGTIDFKEYNTSPRIRISGKITGLTPGLHGFHIHEYGDLTDGCASFGGHYNPFNMNHGSPKSNARHVGDLGNLLANKHGVARFNIAKRQRFSLTKQSSVLGRGLIVHADEDDLGLGGDEESLRTGNAGARVACCIIAVRALS